jgi:alpha-L-fucosidase 2
MIKRILLLVVLLHTSYSFGTDSKDMTLWFKKSAQNWNEAMPIGNGRLGAMVFGGIEKDRLQLNEESIWTGSPVERHNPNAKKALPKIRKLLFEKKYVEAQKFAQENFMGTRLDRGVATYQSMGDLTLAFKDHESVQDYKRELDLSTAVAKVKYRIGKTTFFREYFSSAVDQAIVVRLFASQPGQLNFSASLSRPGNKADVSVSPNLVSMKEHVGDENGVQFETQMKIKTSGGSVTQTSNGFEIQAADEVTFFIVAGTNYRGDDPHLLCEKYKTFFSAKNYEQIKAAHIKDYQTFFNRVDFDLGTSQAAYFSTDEKINAFSRGLEDPGIITQYFQFGRYLLISSSRPGCLPANLQGIWADGLTPPWNADYHININIQMNYWPAEVTNLSECHGPFLEFIDALRERGRETAKKSYGCDGFVGHHTTDLWHYTAPIGKVVYGLWPHGVGWSVLHLWEHYLYTQDDEFLKNFAYPVMKEAAQFYEDWLVKDPTTGYLVSGPSGSPENTFLTADGQAANLCMGPTMDHQIINEVFNSCIKASEILNSDKFFRKKLLKIRDDIAPMKIGSDGRLMEWTEEFKERNPGHRHISHLFGLHPGNQINLQTPELLKAARNTIDFRLSHGGGHTGWSRAWIINFFARMLDGEKAYENILALLGKSTLPNMFDTHPPFQIDGNFGGCAGIAEMLLQSHAGEIHLLPAFPKAWQNGHIKGLVARGGFVVDMYWQNGKLEQVRLLSKYGKPCTIRYGNKVVEKSTTAGEVFSLDENLVFL